jgi:hypothetical protein
MSSKSSPRRFFCVTLAPVLGPILRLLIGKSQFDRRARIAVQSNVAQSCLRLHLHLHLHLDPHWFTASGLKNIECPTYGEWQPSMDDNKKWP